MAEVLSSLEQGLGDLVRKVGRLFIESVLESEVERIAGPRSSRRQDRRAYRWGVEQGFCLIDGQRVPIARPRVRECGGKELPLGTYQLFQRITPAEETVWSNIMRGLSMRDYKLVLQQFMDAYGLCSIRVENGSDFTDIRLAKVHTLRNESRDQEENHFAAR